MIRFEHIGLNYHRNRGESISVLDFVNTQISASEFVCVLGPSGCGKTTLLNLVAGFLKPTSGRLLFKGKPVVGPGPDRGVIFQDATLFPWLTVHQNVGFGLHRQKNGGGDTKKKIRDALAMVGMADKESLYPYALSGGMRQRVGIARVLVLKPEALLMDEPFSALDANTREHLQDELLRIWATQHQTIFYITHSVEEAVYLADRVLVMGPSPGSIRRELRIDLKRPRDRFDLPMRDIVKQLRAELRQLPCCLLPIV